jgi:hypothetical protein
MAIEQASRGRLSADSEKVLRPRLVRWRPYLINLPALLILIGILYPFVLAVYYSFTNYTLTRPSTTFIGLTNYERMITDPGFVHSTLVTFGYAIGSTGIELLLGLIIAAPQPRNPPCQNSAHDLDLPDDDRPCDRRARLEADDAVQRWHLGSNDESGGATDTPMGLSP